MKSVYLSYPSNHSGLSEKVIVDQTFKWKVDLTNFLKKSKLLKSVQTWHGKSLNKYSEWVGTFSHAFVLSAAFDNVVTRREWSPPFCFFVRSSHAAIIDHIYIYIYILYKKREIVCISVNVQWWRFLCCFVSLISHCIASSLYSRQISAVCFWLV